MKFTSTASESSSGPRVAAGSLAVAASLALLAGCGSSSSSSSSSSAATPASTAATTAASTPAAPAVAVPPASGTVTAVSLAALPSGELAFDKKTLAAKAGKVVIAFTNTAQLEHNVTVESSAGSVVGQTPSFQGGTKALTLTLAAGTYKFYCSVPGHRAGGMEGTLTVR